MASRFIPIFAIMVCTLNACSDEAALDIAIPDGPLSGTVALTASGNFDELVVLVDSAVLGQGAGPALTLDWDTTLTDDGTHSISAQGYTEGSSQPILAEISVEVDNSVGATTTLTTDTNSMTTSTTTTTTTTPTTTTTSTTTTIETGGEAECFITTPEYENTVWGTFPVKVAGEGIAEVAFSDGSQSYLASSAPWEWSWDTTALANKGTHVGAIVTIDATMTNGGVCHRVQPIYVVDQDSIYVGIDSPSDGGCVSGTAGIQFAFGGGAGRERLELYADGNFVQQKKTYPWEILWNTTKSVDDGLHTLKAVGIEKKTLNTVETEITICVDNATGCAKPPKECSGS